MRLVRVGEVRSVRIVVQGWSDHLGETDLRYFWRIKVTELVDGLDMGGR